MVRHLNNGACPKCLEIINKYKGFHEGLANWFKELQAKLPEAHVSHAGRGKAEQEQYKKAGTSLAGYGESPHNYNLALDIFRIASTGKAEWQKSWYIDNIFPLVPEWIMPGGNFKRLKDYPHFEVKAWRSLVDNGSAKLVE